MAASGQILSILDKLSGGLETTERRKGKSKKKERQQHRTMLNKLQVALGGARAKGQSTAGLGSIISGLAALTGAGLPLVLALQFAGSMAGGNIGATKAKARMKEVMGQFKGTKFGKEGETYIDEVGSDVLGKAMTDTAITAMTAGAGSQLTSGLSSLSNTMTKIGEKLPGLKEAISKLKLPKISPNPIVSAGKGTINLPKIPQGLKDVLAGMGKGMTKGVETLADVRTPLGGLVEKGGTGAGMAEILGGKASDKLLDRAFGTLYGGYQKSKQPSIYEYQVPESLGTPSSGYGGYYG